MHQSTYLLLYLFPVTIIIIDYYNNNNNNNNNDYTWTLRPLRQAELVQFIRDTVTPTPVTLSIGDGANDVAGMRDKTR